MKLLFSEAAPDATHYVYPYAVWGFLEPDETPADAFASGFLPGTAAMDRFYLVRQLRVPLAEWKPSSENRRLLRKASRLRAELIPRARFDFTESRRTAWLAFAEARFGVGVMPGARLDRLMSGAVITHLLHFTDVATGAAVGTVLMFLEPPQVAFYYYAFYSLEPGERSAGMEMMNRAVEYFSQAGMAHLYLGSCYSEAALYKTQFEPLEFFNGFRWSRNLGELKQLVRTPLAGRHRLETPEFMELQPAPLAELARGSAFRCPPNPP